MTDVVMFLREGANFFRSARCFSCQGEVVECVFWPVAFCEECGLRVAVDLLRMRIRR